MSDVLTFLETLAPVEALRFSRWAYAAVNTLHVLAIALVVGGAVPLALRLYGLWRDVPRSGIVRVLSVTAGGGLALAVITGSLLFATRAGEYAANPALPVKMVLVLVGAVSAVQAHRRFGSDLNTVTPAVARRLGLVSLICWIGALAAGRLIALVRG